MTLGDEGTPLPLLSQFTQNAIWADALRLHQEETKMKDRATLPMSPKIARHLETFSEYSQLSGIPLEKLIDGCLSEYLAEHPAKN